MIVDKIRSLYEAKREIPRGNPTGSRFGSCAAQLQFLLYPDVSKPGPRLPRALMVMEEGRMIEEWWRKRLDEVYAKRAGAWVGLREEPFYFPVSLSSEEAEAAQRKLEGRVIWGTVLPSFEPPSVWHENGKILTRLLPCQKCDRGRRDHGWPCGKRIGIVLDQTTQTLWCPTYIDRAVLDPDYGLMVVEEKAVSSYQFRRMVMGQVDYEKRCQLAGEAAATGLDPLWLVYRKDTAHIAEILFTRKVERVRIEITKPNGQKDVYLGQADRFASLEGEAVEFPADALWETAEVWTPFDPSLLEAIQTRIRRVVTASPTGPWHREAGPNFRCPTCHGTSIQTFRKGTTTPLKVPKLCEDCQGGFVEEAALPQWPCAYCSVVLHCFKPAKVRLEVTDKPVYLVKRADFEASRITFSPPESALVEAEVVEAAS